MAVADPSQASTSCQSGLIEDLATESNFRNVGVPAGATATFVASGTWYTKGYFAGYTRGEYVIRLDGSIAGDSVVGYQALKNYYSTTYVASVEFANQPMGSWTNNTGSDAVLQLRTWATEYYGNGIDWSVRVALTGPNTTGVDGVGLCPAASESFGPNAALGQQCPSCTGSTTHSVNSFTGNEHYVLPGFSMKTLGPGIDFSLASNSLAAASDGAVGHGWSTSFGMSLGSGPSGSKVVSQESGATVAFSSSDGGATWSPAARFNATLVKNSDGSWTFTRANREIFTFGSTGRLTSVADRNGYSTSLTYDSDGLSSVADTAGHQVDVDWAAGRISTVTDISDAANPRTVGFGYDAAGDLTSYTDIGGGVWSLGYDSSHRLVSVRSPRFVNGTAARQFHYDSQGRVDWEQDPLGRRTVLNYDTPTSGATQIVDPAGNSRVDYYNSAGQRYKVTVGYGTAHATSTMFTYNSAGMITGRKDGSQHDWLTVFGDIANPFSPTQTTDPLGRVRKMEYNASGQLTKLTDANLVVTTYAYDANGNPKTTTVASGSNTPATITYNYDDASRPGQLTSVVDPRNKTWAYGHNPQGDLTSVTDPLGRITQWTYNPQGWPLTKISAAGSVIGEAPSDHTTHYSHDAYGSPVEVIDPLDHHTNISYDADGNVKTITNAEGDVTTKTWDAADQLISVTSGTGSAAARTLTYTYGLDGNVATRGYSAETTYTEAWNPLGLLDSTTDPDGRQTTYGYDANGNLTTTTVGVGTSVARTTRFAYDVDNNRVSTTLGYGSTDASTLLEGYNIAPGTGPCTGVTNTVYCTTSTDGAGQVTTYFYDALGVVIAKNQPGGKSSAYAHDAAGRRTGVTDPAGHTTAMTYNDAGELESKSSGPTTTYTYTYTPNGLRFKVFKAGNLMTSYGYNNADQVISISGVGYVRDAAGRVKSMTYPDGRVVSYDYNAAGDITTLDDGAGNTIGFGYSADGVLNSKTFPGGNTISTNLDGEGLPTSIKLGNGSGNQLAKVDYTYNAAYATTNEVFTTAAGARTSAYLYDGQGRLASSTSGPSGASNPTVSYDYDAAGNPTTFGSATQAFNAAGELTSVNNGATSTTYGYNAAGDRTRAIPSAGLGSTYAYDNDHRMVAATVPPPPSTPESDYHPLQGSRILDTRAATRTGTCTTTCATLTAGGTLTFQVTGKGGVPSNASSVVLDVTVPSAATGGAVTLYPSGTTVTTGRNITTTSGNTQTQPVIIALSATGKVTVKSTVAADVIIDVAGYYATTTNQTGAVFDSVDTIRTVDTRSGLGVCTPSPCGTLAAGGTTTIQMTGQAGIPTVGIVGVAYSLTAITPSATGSATAYAADQSRPATTNLSYTSGITSSALAVTPLSSSGQIKLYSSKAADYALDIVGYYTRAADGSSSMFVPFDANSGISPRVLVTAQGTGTCQPAPCAKLNSNVPMGVSLAHNNAVPGNATSAVLSATVVAPTATGSLSFAPGTGISPTDTAYHYTSGVTATSTAVVGVQNAWLTTENHGGTADLILDVQGYFVAPKWTTTYTYDEDGLLASTTPPTGTGTTEYTYDRLGSNGTPQLLNDQNWDYIYGPDGALLATTSDLQKGGNSTFYALTDSQNSVRGQFNSSAGLTTSTNYTPFGSPTSALPTGAGGYAGGITDPGAPTGFTYLINRYYDPATGVFTTPDPLLDITGQPYAYANNNPTNETDPTGACPSCVGGLLGAVFGAGGNLLYQVGNNLSNGCGAFDNISWGQVAAWGLIGAELGTGLGGIYGSFGKAAAKAGAGETTTLFRAVGQGEADDILAAGGYRNAPGLEGKYFFRTQEQAERYGQMMNKSPGFGSPNYLTSGRVPTSALGSAEGMEAGSEGAGLFFRGDLSQIFNVFNHGLIP